MTFTQWLFQKYLDWQKEMGNRQTVEEFAEYLGIKQPTLSEWLNGKYKPKSAKQIALLVKRYGFEVYDILEISRPEAEALLSGFPPEFRDPLLAALKEINEELVKSGISQSTPAAKSIIKEAFARYGVNFTFTEK